MFLIAVGSYAVLFMAIGLVVGVTYGLIKHSIRQRGQKK
jgi:hypothetical protein